MRTIHQRAEGTDAEFRHQPQEHPGVAYVPAWPQWRTPRGCELRRLVLRSPDKAERVIYVPKAETHDEIEARVLVHLAAHSSWYQFAWNCDRLDMSPTSALPRDVNSTLVSLFSVVDRLSLTRTVRSAVPSARSFSAGHRATRARGVLRIPMGHIAYIQRINYLLRCLLPEVSFSAWTVTRIQEEVPAHQDRVNDPRRPMLMLSRSSGAIWTENPTGVETITWGGRLCQGTWRNMCNNVIVMPGHHIHAVHSARTASVLVLYSTAREVRYTQLARLRALGFPLALGDAVPDPRRHIVFTDSEDSVDVDHQGGALDAKIGDHLQEHGLSARRPHTWAPELQTREREVEVQANE
eukprot:1934522-Amphidinium_carterae.2